MSYPYKTVIHSPRLGISDCVSFEYILDELVEGTKLQISAAIPVRKRIREQQGTQIAPFDYKTVWNTSFVGLHSVDSELVVIEHRKSREQSELPSELSDERC